MEDPVSRKFQGLLLLMFVVLITLVGIFILIGLRVAWRRFMKRLREQGKHPKERSQQPDVDPWDVSAKRLTENGDYDPRIDTPLPDSMPSLPDTQSLDDPFDNWNDQREDWDSDASSGDDDDEDKDEGPPFPYGKP